MNLIHRSTASVLFTIVIFSLLLALIYQARRPLTAFIFAILFAYLLDPLVARLQTFLRRSRGLAVAATYLLLGVAIAAFGITVGPRIFREAERLGRELPELMEKVGSGRIAQQFGSQRGWDYKTQLQVQQFLSGHRDEITQYAQIVANRAAGLAGSLMWLLLIPILAAFLLKDQSHFAEMFLQLIAGNQQRLFFRSLLNDLDAMLATFIRAQLSFAALGLVAYTSFLLLAQFPYAFAVGAIAGLLEIHSFRRPAGYCSSDSRNGTPDGLHALGGGTCVSDFVEGNSGLCHFSVPHGPRFATSSISRDIWRPRRWRGRRSRGPILVGSRHGQLAHHLESMAASAGSEISRAQSGSAGSNLEAQTNSEATQQPR
jgi:hypothetical protein